MFNRQIFWHSLGVPPPRGPPQNHFFWMAQVRVPVCLDISRYLTDKYFVIVWGCHPPKINFLNSLTWVPVCFDISRCLITDKYFDVVWGATSLGTPIWTPKNQFFERLNLGCHCFMIRYQEIFNWLIFWLYFSGGSIIRYFWIIADFTVDKKYFWASQH